MTSNEDAEIAKHVYKPLKCGSPTPLYYPLERTRTMSIDPADVQSGKVQCSYLSLAEKQTLTNELRQCNDQEADFEQNTKTSTIKQRCVIVCVTQFRLAFHRSVKSRLQDGSKGQTFPNKVGPCQKEL